MNVKLTKGLKMFFVLAVIGLALLYARFGAEIATVDIVPPEAIRVGREFRDARHNNRHEMHFTVNNLSQFLNFINALESSMSDSLSILRKNVTADHFLYLTEIRTSVFNQFISQIRAFESNDIKQEQSFRNPDVIVDLRAQLAINESFRQRHLTDLENSTNPTRTIGIQNQLVAVQATIDSINFAIREHEHNRENGLFFLTVSRVQSGARELLNFGGGFAARFMAGFAVLTVVLLLLLLLSGLVLRSMSALGIQTSSKDGGKYDSHSGSNDKRKVKRVRKDKDAK